MFCQGKTVLGEQARWRRFVSIFSFHDRWVLIHSSTKDYDGGSRSFLVNQTFLTNRIIDTAMITWKPEIVSSFQQQKLNHVPQGFLLDNFDKQIEFVDSFAAKVSTMKESEAEREMHRVFVDGLLHETRTGIYSNFHNASLYERGYSHSETVRLAHM